MKTLIIIQRRENGEVLAVSKDWTEALLELSRRGTLGNDVSFIQDGDWVRLGDCAVDWVEALAGVFDDKPEAFEAMFPWLACSIFDA